jgi:hypothetical protein
MPPAARSVSTRSAVPEHAFEADRDLTVRISPDNASIEIVIVDAKTRIEVVTYILPSVARCCVGEIGLNRLGSIQT